MEKHSQEETRTCRKSEGKRYRQKIRDGESQKREDAGAQKVGKSLKKVFFPCFVALEGRKVGSQKPRVRR